MAHWVCVEEGHRSFQDAVEQFPVQHSGSSDAAIGIQECSEQCKHLNGNTKSPYIALHVDTHNVCVQSC